MNTKEIMIQDRVTELMHSESLPDKESFSPFRRKNFEEFLQNMNDEAVTDLFEWMSENNNTIGKYMEQLGRAFYCLSIEYWERLATAQAEKEVKEKCPEFCDEA